jgi:hypothetical protein
MSLLGKLKRDFLAALPVIGPHADIEAELLLAGIKPVGWLWIYPDDETFKNWRMRKEQRDRKILDRAVAEGKLKSIDTVRDNIPVRRFYCQPGREEDMQWVKAIEDGDENAARDCKKEWNELYGYRKRDVLFYNYYFRFPEQLGSLMRQMNANAQMYHREKLLEECGIDPAQWVEQLRQEHILD